MLLTKKIKLNVTERDAATLEFMQGKCRGLYNWWVLKLKSGEQWRLYECKKTFAESRKHDPELNQVYGKLLAEVYFRLDAAMQAFFLYGNELVLENERNTSKACSTCEKLQAMPLWKRTYCCTECGLVMDRDENSAHNILTRFLARLGSHTGDPVRCADVFTAINTFQHV